MQQCSNCIIPFHPFTYAYAKENRKEIAIDEKPTIYLGPFTAMKSIHWLKCDNWFVTKLFPSVRCSHTLYSFKSWSREINLSSHISSKPISQIDHPHTCHLNILSARWSILATGTNMSKHSYIFFYRRFATFIALYVYKSPDIWRGRYFGDMYKLRVNFGV